MKITVGKGSCGIAAGAGRIYSLLEEGLSEKGLDIPLSATGCIGMCYLEPIVNVIREDKTETFVLVGDEAASEILKYVAGEESGAEKHLISGDDLAFLSAQERIALANCGLINPDEISEYLERGGYEAARKVLLTMDYSAVIEEIKASGLLGRGGAGFPTWFKWQAARDAAGDGEEARKYIICNADEGDPGAFMDRAILEGDPHAVLEGMLIAGFAIGASEGIIYVRAEYPLAIARLRQAIKQAGEQGFLGADILGSGVSFRIRIKAGAGAFVCGEETALIASLEGERGMPRLKPPFPAQRGFLGQPTNINNVETYANVPWIIRNGGARFASMGTEKSKGTKVFALTGKIRRGGLAEVPMGKTIRDIVFGIGGGIKDGGTFKAVQMGGPSGGCIPMTLIDTPIDYQELARTGAIMGSGGMVVMDEHTCMVDMARFFLDFTRKESCGKCTHCRIGNKRLLEILERICEGEGRDGDIDALIALSEEIKAGSLCALGQTAPNPVLTTIKYFRDEYEAHIYDKKCPAANCKALVKYAIDSEKCTGCTLCAKKCPVGAITGQVKSPHAIEQDKCTKCGNCLKVCRFGAVEM